MTELKLGDVVIVGDSCKRTASAYGFDDRMKDYFGTIQRVGPNDCRCG
jgi:hypothetical protein